MQSSLYQFQKRQIALIARVTPYAMAGHLVNTTVIAIALAGSVRPAPLVVWCAYSYATALFLIYRHMRNRRRRRHGFRGAARKATIYAFLLALPWSSLAVLYLGSLSQGEELLLVALGIGMAACGTILLSAIPSAAFSYMSVVLLPSAWKCFLVGQNGYLLLGTLALSYWGSLAALISKTGRDIRERQESELALAERNAQITLAGTVALVGSYGYDLDSDSMQVSAGYAAIHGLPQGTTVTTRREWRNRVHPDDIGRLLALRSHALGELGHEYNAEYRLVLPDRGVRWIESRSLISYDGDGNAKRVLGVNIDFTDRKRAELALAERNTQLELASKCARVGSFSVDFSTGIARLTAGCAAIYGLPDETIEASRDDLRKLVHPEDLPALEALRDQAFLAQQREFIGQFRIVRASDGAVRWLEMRSLIFYHQAGKPSHLIGVNIDVTERKRAEERQSILVAELSHRVKNVLANVCAVVSHTRQESTSVAEFVATLDGRIRSLTTAHELLSSGGWQGISLTELVHLELAPYATRHNTDISGPEIVLRPEAGQAMAMVLHELATNAAKYGALSTSDGRVSIRWHRRMNGQCRSSLVLEWREMGGPPVLAAGKPSYGTSTIRDLIPYELGGTVDLVPAPDGIRCHLELPAEWLTNDGEFVSRAVARANDHQEMKALRQVALKAVRCDAKSYRNETRGPPPHPIASTRFRVRGHKTSAFAKADHPEIKRVLLTRKAPISESCEHTESALRAIDSHIVKGEHRLVEHGKLMEKLKDGGNLILAHQLQLNLETGLRLMHSRRARLLKEWSNTEILRAS